MAHSLRTKLLGSIFLAGTTAFSVSPQAQAQTRAPAPAADASTMSEVIVTAEKRSQRLQDVPVSISVVSGLKLEQLQSTQMGDWSGYVPGLTYTTNGAPGETTLALDGVAPVSGASEVGVYVNDTPVGSSSSFQGGNGLAIDLLPYDLDRLEVLRGPQGTLYGASTMGGLVKYVLTAPNLSQFSGRVGGDVFGVQHGNGAGGGGRGEVNIPLINGQLGLRVSAYDESTPGFIDDTVTGKKGDNGLHQGGGRIAALWRPSADLSVQLSTIYQQNHAANQSLVALDQSTGRPFGDSLSNLNTRGEPFTQELQLYDATVNWDLHWAQLTSISSYQQFTNNITQDLTNYIGVYLGDFGGPGPGQADLYEHYRLQKFTQELRVASPTGQSLEWLVGAFYTAERGVNNEGFHPFDASGAAEPALDPLEYVTLPSTYQEYAVFGDATYHFTEQFDLSAGLRYAHNNQTFVESEGGALLNPADPSAAVLNVPGKSSEGVTTFSVSPRFHFTHDTMVYARVASGYQPGGPNAVLPGQSGSTFPSQFNSSTLIDYQIGLKSTFLDGRATADLSAFYIDWTKIQVSVLVGAQSAVENAGAARSEGFDFSGSYAPVRGLVLGGNLAYTDAYLTSAVPSLGTAAGARLPGVPLWSGSITADYSMPLSGDWRGFAGGGYRYVGSRFSDVAGSTANGAPQGATASAYGVVDLHVGVKTRDLTLSLFAKNLTDERAYLAPANFFNDALGAPIDIKAPVLQPRTVGVSIDKAF